MELIVSPNLQSEWVGVNMSCDDENIENLRSSESVAEHDVTGETDDFFADLMSEDESTISDNFDGDECAGQGDSASLSNDRCVIFQNCPLTVTTSALLIKKFQMQHNLSQEAGDLLTLMKLHFPLPYLFPTLPYLLNKQLPVLRDPLEYTYYCSRCLQEISDKSESSCPNVSCGSSVSEQGSVSSFIEVPLEPQLVTIL